MQADSKKAQPEVLGITLSNSSLEAASELRSARKSPRLLGSFKAGRQSQNLAFSGPGKQTLYMTAREGLYRVRMLSKGPDRLGK